MAAGECSLALPHPFLVLDIETVLDPELPIATATDAERLPAPPHHRVVVIGVLLFDSSYEPKRINAFSEAKVRPGCWRIFRASSKSDGPAW